MAVVNRINQIAADARQDSRKLLIPYLVAGDPDLDNTLALMHKLVEQGADIIELGIPFSDPSSDGPVIQRGVERALAGGASLQDTLTLTARFRETNSVTPVVLMGYLNPIEIMGYQQFVEAASKAGVDGVLTVDMPPVEATALNQLLKAAGIETIFLVAPTTSPLRAKQIADQCSGYLYYVSLKGITGAALTETESVNEKVSALRELTDLPIVIGFGIKDGATAQTMARMADGVVVGSALVEQISDLRPAEQAGNAELDRITKVIADCRQAIDNINK